MASMDFIFSICTMKVNCLGKKKFLNSELFLQPNSTYNPYKHVELQRLGQVSRPWDLVLSHAGMGATARTEDQESWEI